METIGGASVDMSCTVLDLVMDISSFRDLGRVLRVSSRCLFMCRDGSLLNQPVVKTWSGVITPSVSTEVKNVWSILLASFSAILAIFFPAFSHMLSVPEVCESAMWFWRCGPWSTMAQQKQWQLKVDSLLAAWLQMLFFLNHYSEHISSNRFFSRQTMKIAVANSQDLFICHSDILDMPVLFLAIFCHLVEMAPNSHHHFLGQSYM